eukprot:300585-Rhodomonas_salina.2
MPKVAGPSLKVSALIFSMIVTDPTESTVSAFSAADRPAGPPPITAIDNLSSPSCILAPKHPMRASRRGSTGVREKEGQWVVLAMAKRPC